MIFLNMAFSYLLFVCAMLQFDLTDAFPQTIRPCSEFFVGSSTETQNWRIDGAGRYPDEYDACYAFGTNTPNAVSNFSFRFGICLNCIQSY